MVSAKKDPVLVILQMTGGNDYMNTVIPYTDPLYRDNRPSVGVAEDRILKINDKIGFHPEMGPMKNLYEQGRMAIIHGVGYANSPRSHFRSMDIWHTCEPDKLGTEGWLGRATLELDPHKENVVTAISFGPSLPRALAFPGVPVACVDDLESYGLLTGIEEVEQRNKILDSMKGADILKVAPEQYTSSIEYPDTTIARKLKGVSQVHLAGLGTRVFYCDHGSFDSHSNQVGMHDKLWKDVSEAVETFFDDLREHDAGDNVIMLMFTEFGRRVHDNGSGTDHGAAGAAFVLGDGIKGGEYGEYPSSRPENLEQGDLVPNYDFRGIYSTILEGWMGMDANPLVGGNFEKLGFL
jgi:uncharacterized protein (DUF1501 family)